MATRLNGLFAVYKPTGVTSANVTNIIKRILRHGCAGHDKLPQDGSSGRHLKVGHGGTLDFDASGVLVIGVGTGTRKLETYLRGTKKYTAVGLFGMATNTHSRTGEVTEVSSYDHITEDQFLNALSRYHGHITQVPPIYSALKVGGHTMASLAAAGLPVAPKPARTVMVNSIKCISYRLPEFTLEISCGGGFYVRKFIHDLGKDLNSCACMTSLERTEQGPYHLGENVLHEQDWTYNKIVEALEDFSLRDR